MSTSTVTSPAPRRRDYRLRALLALAGIVVAIGAVVTLLPGRGITTAPKENRERSGLSELKDSVLSGLTEEVAETEPPVSPQRDPEAYRKWEHDKEAKEYLRKAAASIGAKRYDEAIAIMNSGLEVLKGRPESYVVIGNALIGKKDYVAARDFMNAAIERDPKFADAYFGYAVASEELGELDSALGAMRSYLHTEKNSDPYRLKVAQARAAIWEWEAKLGRGEWGPTKGIPPGFTAAELKRDGKGVGTKMPIPGTEGPDGLMKYEIKSGERLPIFKP
ncbi:tetratricopeptide repeat protein [Noviherbaspirillum sp. ST9]|uniref:tetratricopeptide repeat protein n=1 Tax=Noviherbaspirillum sp. ST9 TaxID=3401606 RepID=UPI003B588CD4